MKRIGLFVGIYLLFHSFRDLLQYLRVKSPIAEIGHAFGIRYTEKLLGLFGLNYKTEYEIYFFLVELVLGLFFVYFSLRSD